MTEPPVTTKVHQPLYIHGSRAPDITFDLMFLVDGFTNPHQFVIGEVVNPSLRRNADVLADFLRGSTANTMNVSKRDHNPLRGWNINTSDARQSPFSLNFGNKKYFLSVGCRKRRDYRA